ncbi:MAG: nucleotide exchange factor GrpE [Sulfuricurvum sp.]|uniref:nucleotide exchange factor GrpE n=1 Tax=Sulfuricurvum sp. TaxID=2025608 RepID=UPI0026236435|nr:nucleotide exchange factor GrpE [Sulfuricurvum sp.]MDD2837843.1 nucleotide exchange factor GrpE [Sulfuricurvum sp.]MDD3597373.1 nucleotide exchange factor GrpE [Sulfuricurvum sp.]MDD4883717.1 nucleotide exchange factor GrpE [Sulfuricurvum sp.]
MSNEVNEETIGEEQVASQESETIVDESMNELEIIQAELASFKDKYARVHADFDNIKKRLEREKYQALEYANEKFAKDLIPVVDSLGMAINAAEIEAEPAVLLEKLKEGVELTMKQLLGVLEKHGVTPVDESEPFDPNIHNAVQRVDSPDHESGAIVNTFQKGYRYKERTLRDAMVVIAN